ncbi:MAG: radical SAM protein [Nanobdellota archaeon]
MKNIKFLMFILTYKCNSRCRHCDIWNYKDIDINKKIVNKILDDPLTKNVTHVELTGGEPFLWGFELSELVNNIHEKLDTNVGISSNGLLTDEIVSVLKNVKKRRRVVLRFSLDGNEATHDFQRGVKGSFKSVMKTADKINKNFPETKIEFVFTLTQENYHQIGEVFDLLRKDFLLTIGISQYVANYKTMLRNNLGYGFSQDQIKTIKPQLRCLYDYYIKNYYYQEALWVKILLRFLDNKKQNIPCSAPKDGIIIEPEKNIYSCINEPSIGKFKDKLYDSINWEKRKYLITKAENNNCKKCALRFGRYASLYPYVDKFRKKFQKK